MSCSKLPLTDVDSSIPVCAPMSYEVGVCFCFMDQCLEDVRFQHMQYCGTTTAPTMDTVQTQDKNNVTSNATDYNVEKHLAEMFGWVNNPG